MGDFKPGSMNIREQEKTFDGFVRFVAWAMAVILLILVFMALVNA
ncbi:MAG: aa3-type cytochrome c oxidase subunit IV [Defluviimonas sp.]|nr:aa3-type cytochrome c oxidase subunit IV [Paracoccaceae bacterium]MCC0063208.1 aa3-type cytochrome c oxidase subunit IV [Defluviimonas sp.]